MTCGAVINEPRVKVQVKGVEHVAIVVHRCSFELKHPSKDCKCACGYQWNRKQFGGEDGAAALRRHAGQS